MYERVCVHNRRTRETFYCSTRRDPRNGDDDEDDDDACQRPGSGARTNNSAHGFSSGFRAETVYRGSARKSYLLPADSRRRRRFLSPVDRTARINLHGPAVAGAGTTASFLFPKTTRFDQCQRVTIAVRHTRNNTIRRR